MTAYENRGFWTQAAWTDAGYSLAFWLLRLEVFASGAFGPQLETAINGRDMTMA